MAVNLMHKLFLYSYKLNNFKALKKTKMQGDTWPKCAVKTWMLPLIFNLSTEHISIHQKKELQV